MQLKNKKPIEAEIGGEKSNLHDRKRKRPINQKINRAFCGTDGK